MRGIQAHKDPRAIEQFDFDYFEFKDNRKEYHHIRPKQENDSFHVYINGKYRGCRSRLLDAVKLRDSLLQNDLIQQSHK